MKALFVVYDNESFIHFLPVGLAYLASALKRAGHEVEIYNQDMHHYPDEHLTRHLDENRYDVVGVSMIGGYYQYRKLLKLSAAINASRQRPHYVLGGHGPAPEPEYFMRKTGADAIVIGEGELTVVELFDALGSPSRLAQVKGVAWRNESGECIVNERRELIKDIDSIPMPSYELFPIEYYRLIREPKTTPTDFVLQVLSGRGCPFHCNFCYRMDEGFRARSPGPIIDEIRFLNKRYGINYIFFGDELLMSSVKRTTELCEAFLNSGIKFKWWCNGRLNFAKPDLLKLMKKAGCIFINYGIEAFDNQILKNMNKALDTDTIVKGIEATLAVGVSPGLNIIFGNIGENAETLKKGVDFLLKYSDGAQMRTIRPVTPYPGAPLYYHAIEKGLLKDCEDFYERKHLNSDLLSVNFTDMSDEEFHHALYEANRILIKDHFEKKAREVEEQARELYIGMNVEFRGFRPK